jgi:predicted HTH domain antitoxin
MHIETVQVAIPEDPIRIFDATKDISYKLKLWVVMALYSQGKVSMGKAAQVLEIGKWEFAELLNENSYPVFNTTIEDINKDEEAMKFLNAQQ